MLRLTLMLFVVAYLFTSCKQHQNTSYLPRITASLKAANESIANDNRDIVYAILEKTRDPHTATAATIWLPRAESLARLSNEILHQIKYLKGEMPDQAKARDLFRRLVQYRQRVFGLFNSQYFADRPSYREQIRRDSISMVNELPLGSLKNEQNWLDSTFKNADYDLNIAMLHSVENDILVSNNKLLNYFFSHSTIHYTGPCDLFEAIAVLNSSYVKPGDVIEVTAGIGSFRIDAKPAITIKGKQIKLNDDGSATYSFTTGKKPGKYAVPVKIEFYKPDGTRESISKNCYYTVAQ